MLTLTIFGLLALCQQSLGSHWDSSHIAYSDILETEPEWTPPPDEAIYRAVAAAMIKHEQERLLEMALKPLSNNFFIGNEIATQASGDISQYIPGVGVFELGGPFAYLKAKPVMVKTKFLFFRSEPNLASGVAVPLGKYTDQNNALTRADELIDPAAKTYVVIHGFMSKCDPKIWTNEMVYSLLYSSGSMSNVICVDWSDGCSSFTDYTQAVANTRVVGKQIANLLQSFQEKISLQLDNVHLIGHSLGAHVAGFAGSYLPGIGRITGLDPAGPLFNGQPNEVHLDKADAKFVDVIHTNAKNLMSWSGISWRGGFGTHEEWGDIDFYPNGGEDQAGCPSLWEGLWSISEAVACSHTRACLYFIESVKSDCRFMSSPCNSYDEFSKKKNEECFSCTAETCAPMGYHARTSSSKGALFVKTTPKKPFCGFHYMIALKTDPDQKATYGKVIMTMSAGNYTTDPFTMTQVDGWQTIEPNSTLTEILVVPPFSGEPDSVEITYEGYTGWTNPLNWFTNVEPSLKVSMVTITERFGKKLHVCRDVLLPKGQRVRVRVTRDPCSL